MIQRRPKVFLLAAAFVIFLGAVISGCSSTTSPSSAAKIIADTTIDFGQVGIGQTSTKTFTIQNTGNASASITSIAISGDASFSVTGLPTLPFTIVAGKSQTVSVNFSPTAAGALSATATISAAGLGSVTVALKGNGAGAAAKPGTSYTYKMHEVDSSSGKQPTTLDSTLIATIVATGAAYQGKSNVTVLYDDFDTLRYEIETSGDVSIFKSQFGAQGFTFNNPSPWLLLPYGSKKTGVALFAFDTSISLQGIAVPFHVTGTADYLGQDQVSITGKGTASGGQVRVTITINGSALGATLNIVTTQTYSFDGSIGGYFHSIGNTTIPDVTVLGSQVVQGSTAFKTKTLIDYNLVK